MRLHNLYAALLLLLATTGSTYAERNVYVEDADRFPGWKGELPIPSKDRPDATTARTNATKQPGLAVSFGEPKQEIWNGRIEQIALEPRIFRLHGFLTDAECEHIKRKAGPQLTKSSVVDSDTGESVESDVRTSTGTFFGRKEDKVLAAIEKRISLVTMLPEEYGEGIQVLKYINGQEYKPHNDYFHDKVNADPAHGGQRVATVLMYLSTPEEGGETVFPEAVGPRPTGAEWSACAKTGLAVKPKKGDATLFYSLTADGNVDPKSLHGSCPTLKGEKWSATKWLHVSAFGYDSDYQRAKWGECIDADKRCGKWAAVGECEKNPGYMLTSCRKACKKCDDDQDNTQTTK